jgi:hypothetical protein
LKSISWVVCLINLIHYLTLHFDIKWHCFTLFILLLYRSFYFLLPALIKYSIYLSLFRHLFPIKRRVLPRESQLAFNIHLSWRLHVSIMIYYWCRPYSFNRISIECKSTYLRLDSVVSQKIRGAHYKSFKNKMFFHGVSCCVLLKKRLMSNDGCGIWHLAHVWMKNQLISNQFVS